MKTRMQNVDAALAEEKKVDIRNMKAVDDTPKSQKRKKVEPKGVRGKKERFAMAAMMSATGRW